MVSEEGKMEMGGVEEKETKVGEGFDICTCWLTGERLTDASAQRECVE